MDYLQGRRIINANKHHCFHSVVMGAWSSPADVDCLRSHKNGGRIQLKV